MRTQGRSHGPDSTGRQTSHLRLESCSKELHQTGASRRASFVRNLTLKFIEVLCIATGQRSYQWHRFTECMSAAQGNPRAGLTAMHRQNSSTMAGGQRPVGSGSWPRTGGVRVMSSFSSTPTL